MSMSVGGCGSYGTDQTQQSQKSGGLQQLMQSLFNQVDSDGNGSISSDEFSALMSKSTSSGQATSASNTSDLFKSIDKDGDGQISIDEFKKFASGMFGAQVDAAGSSSGSSGIGGMLDKVVHAAEDLFKDVFGDGSSLPPGSSVSASVHATMFQNGGYMVSASVSETMTSQLVNAQTGEVVSSSSANVTQSAQLASALQSYGSHHHHHGGGGLAQLLAELTGSTDDSASDQSAATTADSSTTSSDSSSVAASASGGIIIGAPTA